MNPAPLVAMAIFAAGVAAAQNPSQKPSLARPGVIKLFGAGDAVLGPVTANPGTISFSGVNPDQGIVSGSSVSTVSWSILSGGDPSKNWSLTLQAGSSTFSFCPTVPVSAVQVACNSVSVTGGGSGGCGAPFQLSTTAQQVAAGKQGDTTLVTVTFTLNDSWRYVAATSPPCTLTITYTVDAP